MEFPIIISFRSGGYSTNGGKRNVLRKDDNTNVGYIAVKHWSRTYGDKETMKIYAHVDTEHKFTAISKVTLDSSKLFSELNSERLTISDGDTLKRLTGLRS